jgi:ankyrin repeat domain-containing protein 50
VALAEQGHAEEHILRFLKQLPTELADFYTLMFQKLRKEDLNLQDGVKIFQFVLFTCCPLTANELLHTLGILDDP